MIFYSRLFSEEEILQLWYPFVWRKYLNSYLRDIRSNWSLWPWAGWPVRSLEPGEPTPPAHDPHPRTAARVLEPSGKLGSKVWIFKRKDKRKGRHEARRVIKKIRKKVMNHACTVLVSFSRNFMCTYFLAPFFLMNSHPRALAFL